MTIGEFIAGMVIPLPLSPLGHSFPVAEAAKSVHEGVAIPALGQQTAGLHNSPARAGLLLLDANHCTIQTSD